MQPPDLMGSNFPTALDTTADLPDAATLTGDKLDGSDGVNHVDVHETIHQAVIACETLLGITGSADSAALS